MKRLLLVVILTLGVAGCGGSADKESAAKPADSQPTEKLATKASFVSCLQEAGVDFDTKGKVPGDASRRKHPRGWNPPANGVPAGVEYAGAATFTNGAVADVWIVESINRAEDLEALFAPDTIDPADKATRHANDWFWQSNRNLLIAISDDPSPDMDDKVAVEFDRCLSGA
jgi:hypothetical protein